MRIGITLPQFSADPHGMVAAARRAEDAGIDGVFVYDHYPKPERPEAQHGMTMLGALAVATTRVSLGLLVARIGVVPDRVLLAQFCTVGRLAGPDRLLCGLGVGDRQSDSEDVALGIARPPVEERFARLEFVASTLKNELGLHTWIGGRSKRAEAVAVELGLSRNLWDATDDDLAVALQSADGNPITWGAQVDVTHDDGVDALAARFASLAALGVAWAVAAPTKAAAPDAAARVMAAKSAANL